MDIATAENNSHIMGLVRLRKISQGRRYKDDLDKSDNWFNKELREKLTKFYQMSKVLFIKNEFNIYNVSEVQINLKAHVKYIFFISIFSLSF